MKHNRTRQITSKVLATLLTLSLMGCSGFHRAWKHELSKMDPPDTNVMVGAWEGHWLSNVNGHSGRLRCLITENPDGSYRAWYHAKYKGILSYAYEVDMESDPIQGGFAFKGEADLGRLAGGVYTYEGQVTNRQYHARYASRYDQGTFSMKRPSLESEFTN